MRTNTALPIRNRSRFRSTAWVIVVGAALLTSAVACSSASDEDTRAGTQGLPDTAQSIEANVWILDGEASDPPIKSSQPITIEFEDGTASGNSGCNSFSSSYELSDHDIRIKAGRMTTMACENDEDTTAEQEFHVALESATSVDTTDRDRLVMKTADGELVFGVKERAAE